MEPSELHRGGLEPSGPEGSWHPLDLEPSGTLWAPGEKGKMPDWSNSVPTIIFFFFKGYYVFVGR